MLSDPSAENAEIWVLGGAVGTTGPSEISSIDTPPSGAIAARCG